MRKVSAALFLAGLLAAPYAAAAPKLETVVVKPASKGDVEVVVSVARSKSRFDSGACDARVEFGDGEGRSVDFGVAQTRTVKHTYKKNGRYTVSVKGSGGTPCEGTQQSPVTIAGIAEAKKPEPKKAEPKKDGKKKAEPTKKKGEGKKKADTKGKKKADEKKKDDKK